MKKNFLVAGVFALSMLAAACGGDANTAANNANGGNASNNANGAKPANAAGTPANEFYTGVNALKGERMPDDKELTEQKREFANAIHLRLKRTDANKDFNWAERFAEPTNLKFESDDEQILVITFASKAGGKIEPGDYVADNAEDWVKTAPKDKPMAIITLVNNQGAKRLKGNIKVTSTDKFIMYMFNDKPDAKGLDSMSYGAPFKN